METTGRDALASARLSSLFLVSLLAVASAEVAWRTASPLRLAGEALALGLVLVLGSLLAEGASAVGAATLRRRARLLAVLFVPIPSVLALAVAWSAPHLAAEAASGLILLQLGILLVSEAFAIEVLALWGAFVLTLVAAAGGGLPAVVALCGFLALAGVFFSLDHVVRRLTLWPHIPAPRVNLLLSDAARVLALPVILLAIAVVLLPAPPQSVVDRGALPVASAEVERAYRWLILVALLGTGSLVFAVRWLRGRGRDTPPLVEMPESHLEADELIDVPPADDARYAPARGRVIRAYLRFLARARQAGFRLEPSLTPREIEGRVRRPETELRVLTGLFMDARYGPREPGPEAVMRAEVASGEVCSDLPTGGLRPPRRRRSL